MKTPLKTVCFLAAVITSGCAPLFINHAPLLRAADMVGEIPPGHSQAIVVLAEGKSPYRAYVSAWERKGEWWNNTLTMMPAVIGRSGLAAPGEKREGDGRTPSGSFELKRAFGYAPRADTGLDYRQATANDFWVDDPASPQYNQWVTGAPQAASYERLRRDDRLYEYAAVIEYNTGPVIPGNGSAIFLHIWRGKDIPTAGCVAVSAKNMKKLLKWLDLSGNPVIILGDEKD